MGWPLDYWTIYFGAVDMPPGVYRVRKHHLEASGHSFATGECSDHSSLEAARAAVPRGFVCVPRNSRDVRSIVETWL